MTKVQMKNWFVFSLLLVRRSSIAGTSARKLKMGKEIKYFFRGIRLNAKVLPDYGIDKFLDWDGNNVDGKPSIAVSTEVDEAIEDYKKWSDKLEWYYPRKFADGLEASLRAGFDIAVRPSAGVIGFTIDDLRKMFRNKIPDWVTKTLDGDVNNAPSGTPLWL